MSRINFKELSDNLKEGKTQCLLSYSKLELFEICRKFKISTKENENINAIRDRIRKYSKQAVLREKEKEEKRIYENIDPFRKSTKVARSPNKTLDTTIENNTSNLTNISQETIENNTADLTEDIDIPQETNKNNSPNTSCTDILNKQNTPLSKSTGTIPKIISKSTKTTQKNNLQDSFLDKYTLTRDVTIYSENNTTADGIFNDTENLSIKQESYQDIDEENILVGNNNNSIVEIGNLLDNTNMANTSGYSLKEISRLVPEFDGKNLPLEDYIEKLEIAKDMLSEEEQSKFMNYLRFKVSGTIRTAIKGSRIETIEEFIKFIKKLYPEIDNLHSLYAKLERIQQAKHEPVVDYIERITKLSTKITDKKKNENGITRDALQRFNDELGANTLKYFKEGLNSEIRYELGEVQDFSQATEKAIKIEKNLEKYKDIRTQSDQNTKKIMVSDIFEKSPKQITCCQICKDIGHEALCCNIASCVYCKEPTHSSYQCTNTKDKIKLICKFCNQLGHSRGMCTLLDGNEQYCQYCQENTHQVSRCPIIKKYELCWKCKKNGHNAELCNQIEEKINIPTQTCDICNQKHSTTNCEKFKIFVNQIKSDDQIRCQLCDRWGHSGRDCRNNYNGNNRYNNEYGQRGQHKFCRYCKTKGHNIEQCRKRDYQNKKTQNNNQNIQCPYCKKLGHSLDTCFTIKNLERKQEKFCTLCKKTNHTNEQCQSKILELNNTQGNA